MADDVAPRSPQPSDRIDDNDRQPVLYRIQRAVGSDLLPFEQLDDRFDAVFAATTRAELEAVVSDLPAPSAPTPARPDVGHPVPRSSFSALGDIEIGGWIDVDGDITVSGMIGDITIDLSAARLPPEVSLRVVSLIGDVTVIVPDGARAVAEAATVIGDQKTDLSDARPEMPTVRVSGFSLVGDFELYSLSRVPEKLFRRVWKKLTG